MQRRPLLILTLIAASCVANAQTATSPAKKELVNKILKLQQPGIEGMARSMAEQPAAELLARAQPALAVRVAPDKQEAVAKEIQADARKYVDETVPIVRDRAIKLAPSTVGAVLEEKFTEDELKQVVAFLESPTYVKFQTLGGDMQRALADKLVADTRASVEPKVKALEMSIGKRLGVPPPNAQGAAPALPAAPAGKAAAKAPTGK
ncbi:DUF2059 domain-containing protein [Ramlibacter sp.]|uniref:DUF2059 domain-containing protein n=1 Tax=Ramlibacter sp. TaxID=1917967 RepID=UPI0018024826|nr:DUF2059 domain-containing protein [Ramlibacter sp.]MBA2676647.1 DUF2059 domain-containing protein [Ramlibacter sp.]